MYKLLAILAFDALSIFEAVARGVPLAPLAGPLEARQATLESGFATATATGAGSVNSTVNTATRSITATATGTGTSTGSTADGIQALLDSYPPECSSTCRSSLPIIQACYELDVPGCLAVCQQSAYDGFIDCQNCGIRESGAVVTAAQARQFRRFQQDIEQGCAAQGTSVQSKELELPGSTGSSSTSSIPGPLPQGSGGGYLPGETPSSTSSGPSGSATSPPAAADTPNGAVALPVQLGGVLGGLLVAVIAM